MFKNPGNIVSSYLAKITGLFKFGPREITLPDFLVIGAAKAGTSACITNLGRHPDIFIASKEDKIRCLKDEIFLYDFDYLGHGEIKFFSEKEFYDKGKDWYAAFFNKSWRKLKGEKSPDYLYNYENYNKFKSRTCDRIKDLLPDVKIIILLRDPVNRSFSHWNHIQDQLYKSSEKYHHKSFYDCITDEDEQNFILKNSDYYQNIVGYLSVFGKEKIHIAIQERIITNMHDEYMKMFDFLGVKRKQKLNFTIVHKRDYKDRELDNKSLEYLKEYYRDGVSKLKDLLNDDLTEWRQY